jgi:hypothetical protein
MKKIINDTIDLDELNGARISTWISKLLNLQFQTGTSAIISAYAHADTPHDIGCTLKITYERLENDDEEFKRLKSEDLRTKKIKKFAANNGMTITEVNFL